MQQVIIHGGLSSNGLMNTRLMLLTAKCVMSSRSPTENEKCSVSFNLKFSDESVIPACL
jgi:hypothetical protein